MTDKTAANRKRKPVSQKRVAVVLASLVGSMTIGAAALLLAEGGAMGTAVPIWALDRNISDLMSPDAPLQQGQWQFIIVYESGDLATSAANLSPDDGLAGGTSTARPKANFHFVIQSASGGVDGNAEVGAAWKQQKATAPYATWPDSRSNTFSPYTNAVGICLASDLNREPVSMAQRQTLLHLVKQLQSRTNIPDRNVLFQWELPGQRGTPAQQEFARQFRLVLQDNS